MPDVVTALLRRGDLTRPVLTWQDVASGARVELSLATLDNWVAKTGGLLQDGLGIAAGDRVRLSLPTHWLAVTWALGCWAVGAVVEPADLADGPTPALEVFGEDRAPRTSAPGVVVGLAPLGGPARSRVDIVADTVVDAGAEVLGHPDELFVHDPPNSSTAAVVGSDGALIDHQALLAQAQVAAQALGLEPGSRLLAADQPCDAAGLVHTVVAPLLMGGSVLLVHGRGDLERAGGLDAIVARERVAVVAPLGSRT